MDPDVEARLREVAQERGVSFKEALNSAVSAAHLATLSVEYGAAICSYNADFSRFPGVALVDPDHDS